jgi:hypothetical protein
VKRFTEPVDPKYDPLPADEIQIMFGPSRCPAPTAGTMDHTTRAVARHARPAEVRR